MKAVLLAAALLGLFAASALAQPKADTDDDGRVTRAEYVTARRDVLPEIDRDGDGRISPVELAGLAGAPDGKLHPDDERFFRQIDRDQDGFLSEAEVETVLDRRFERLDRDRDGALSQAERQDWRGAIGGG